MGKVLLDLPKAGRTITKVLAPEVSNVVRRATSALSQGRQVIIQPQEFPEHCLVIGFYKPKKVVDRQSV